MIKFTIQHKHCGMITVVEGYNKYDALHKAHKDSKVWEVIHSEEM